MVGSQGRCWYNAERAGSVLERHEFHVKREARDNPSAKNETKTGAEMTAVQDANEGQWAKWRSVANLYHASPGR